MRLKLDENLGHRWADKLRSAGHDVDTVHEEGLSGAADPMVIQAATRDNRVLVTLDLDFANPFRFPPEHTNGVAVLRVQTRPGRSDLDSVVEKLIDGLERADPKAHLWIVEPSRIRQYESSGDNEEADDT